MTPNMWNLPREPHPHHAEAAWSEQRLCIVLALQGLNIISHAMVMTSALFLAHTKYERRASLHQLEAGFALLGGKYLPTLVLSTEN